VYTPLSKIGSLPSCTNALPAAGFSQKLPVCKTPLNTQKELNAA